MDAIDRDSIDYLSMVPCDFFYKGKRICNVTSFVYPQLTAGQTFEIDLQPTTRERTRRPAQEHTPTWFVIEKVHHKAREVKAGVFAFHIEVILIDASNTEIDSDDNETSIPRRLLSRNK